MKVHKEFNPCGRYVFDFDLCSIKKGYGQLDVPGDAEYLGYWINPTEMKIVEYCEGDISVFTCENTKELLNQVKKIRDLHGDAHIDHGLDDTFRQKFIDVGLGTFLYSKSVLS
ncbi:MAG: hypothetical protein R3279_06435 [Putridiphycobacter sp.]|nr:hypothetical protein [Putridiphycobacter sp.]